MKAPVQAALVAPEGEVEPMLRSARATVAKLSLRLRSLTHEAEQLERAATPDTSAAARVLEASLQEMVEARRCELERELDEERQRAAELLESARREAAASSEELRGAAAAEIEDLTAPHAVAVPVAVGTPPGADGGGAAPQSPWAPPADEPPPDVPRAVSSPTGPAPVLLDVQALTGAVAAAVATALAQTRTVARAHPTEAAVTRQRSFRERALHLDVVLPLLAAAIVCLVLLAWLA